MAISKSWIKAAHSCDPEMNRAMSQREPGSRLDDVRRDPENARFVYARDECGEQVAQILGGKNSGRESRNFVREACAHPAQNRDIDFAFFWEAKRVCAHAAKRQRLNGIELMRVSSLYEEDSGGASWRWMERGCHAGPLCARDGAAV